MMYKINVENMNFEIEAGELAGGTAQIKVNGKPYKVIIDKCDDPGDGIDTATVTSCDSSKPDVSVHVGTGSVTAPIPGLIIDVPVKVGERVEAGDTIVIIEAMKMENNIVSDVAGIVREIKVHKGAHVKTGDLIIIIG